MQGHRLGRIECDGFFGQGHGFGDALIAGVDGPQLVVSFGVGWVQLQGAFVLVDRLVQFLNASIDIS